MAVVELNGAIAIAVVEHSAPSVFCIPEMSDSDHDAPVRGTMAVPKPTSKSCATEAIWLLGAGISQ